MSDVKARSAQYSLEYNRLNREKRNAYAAEYRKKNKLLIAEKNAAWSAKNAQSRAIYNAEYAAANAEKIKAKKREKYIANREAVLSRRAEHYAANREKMCAQAAAWRAENPEKTTIFRQNRRARKQLCGGKLTRGLQKKIFALQRGKCPCCHCELKISGYHLDHIHPLVRGGAHRDDNIQLLCPTCNLSKQAKHPIDFMQSRGYLL